MELPHIIVTPTCDNETLFCDSQAVNFLGIKATLLSGLYSLMRDRRVRVGIEGHLSTLSLAHVIAHLPFKTGRKGALGTRIYAGNLLNLKPGKDTYVMTIANF